MPRSMSFFHTRPQIREQTKTVTRRRGWSELNPGQLFWAVEKAQGLKLGEKVKRLALLRCLSNHPTVLHSIEQSDVIAEGFPELTPDGFIAMFCHHMGGEPDQIVNRIEFEYVPLEQWPAEVSA